MEAKEIKQYQLTRYLRKNNWLMMNQMSKMDSVDLNLN
jgi:hypothetical protein